jgi:hypothetical protein
LFRSLSVLCDETNNSLATVAGFLRRLEEVPRWYPKDMLKEERVLVRKIDLLVLTYGCLSFFTKYLDVTALSKPPKI